MRAKHFSPQKLNIDGEAWGFTVGYQNLLDVNPGTGESAPGLVLTFPGESDFTCWNPTGEGDSFQFKFGFTKSPAAPFFIGLQSIGRVTDPRDGGEQRIVYVGANLVAPGEFENLSCGDDFSPTIDGAVTDGKAIEYEFGGSFRIVRHSN